jgi:hypothetical protein
MKIYLNRKLVKWFFKKGSRDIKIWIPPYQVRGRLIKSGMTGGGMTGFPRIKKSKDLKNLGALY